MFVGRKIDNSIYGCWTVKQWEGQEEVSDNDPSVLAFLAGPPSPTPDDLEIEVQQLLNGGVGAHIDWKKLIKAKFVSDLAFRLGVAPAALTPAQLTNERNRIAAIYKTL